MTSYLVLRHDDEGDGYVESGTYTAASATQAIRAAADKFGDGHYVAVPARSWKPRSVKVETTKVVKLT